MVEAYLSQMGEIPDFLEKYLSLPNIKRLKKIGYFCGMDFASSAIYDFPTYFSRFDHSLSVALLTYRFTKRKQDTLAALFHDISTPCFSHVIDYMNGDFEKQESTEKLTPMMLKKDDELQRFLKEDNLVVEDIIDFKKFPIVDNNRPKLCADRIDGIIASAIFWTKKLSIEEMSSMIEDIQIYQNEDQEEELGFLSSSIAQKVIALNQIIDEYCHSSSDNYMMMLLAKITKQMIQANQISYEDLYSYQEEALFEKIETYAEENNNIKQDLLQFKTCQKQEIPVTQLKKVKIRNIRPLVQGIRYGN